ncbi:hypothetical protein [Mangrovibacterium diazotrophicum]|uniref:Uncharacterized protein n=1 Tax=Mangrovibacterium diazotrophicum TaxID=1261403 RepID=A0A419W6A1_9BACT|nr:hypothetical protein [Mangrovibacterium diazotrophicum]RKD90984.1 hypothetical protein BC643_1331 [Mangrovibacterium diazotrophicum]
MKTYKPYLALTKGSSGNYTLDVVFQSPRTQNIVSIAQQEITQSGKTYWGVIISVSTDIQLMCGPETNVLFTSVEIESGASSYGTVKCVVQQTKSAGYEGVDDEETDIDFGDGD